VSFVPESLRDEAARVEALCPVAPGRLLALRIELDAREGAALRLFESHPAESRFYWDQPEVGRSICGIGALRSVETDGVSRFDRAVHACSAVVDELSIVGHDAPAWAGPLLVGGFAFEAERSEPGAAAASEWAGFAPLSFALPGLCYVRDERRAWLTAVGARAQALVAQLEACAAELLAPDVDAVLGRPPSTATEYCARPDRPHAEWLGSAQSAVASVQRGDFEKVVLARSLGVEADVAYDVVSVLGALRSAQPSCTTFAVTRGEHIFLGSSPERLVRLDGDRLSTAALAGSAPRGRSPEEDAFFARSLRESKKEQEEHAFVVR